MLLANLYKSAYKHWSNIVLKLQIMESNINPIASAFINRDGQKIAYKRWYSNDNIKGNVLIVHGLNSHSGYYHNFAWQLVENDFEVYGIDLRGRGQSEGERYYIPDYIGCINDIDIMVKIIKTENPLTPIFLLGHSTGSVFVSIYAVLQKDKLTGIISESIAFHLYASRFALNAITFLSRFIPHTRLIKLNNQYFSRNKSTIDFMNNDPLLAGERQPSRTLQQIFMAAEFLKNSMAQMQLPVLILHGTGDRITKSSGSEYYMEHISSADKQLNLYEGHYHDLINDKYNGIIIKDIIRWMDKRV